MTLRLQCIVRVYSLLNICERRKGGDEMAIPQLSHDPVGWGNSPHQPVPHATIQRDLNTYMQSHALHRKPLKGGPNHFVSVSHFRP